MSEHCAPAEFPTQSVQTFADHWMGSITSASTDATKQAQTKLTKDDLIARLTQMASGNPEVRQSMRERLRASSGAPNGSDAHEQLGLEHETQSPKVSRAEGDDSTPPADLSRNRTGAAGVAARNEIMTRLSQLSSLNEALREELVARSDELGAASRDAVALRKSAAEHAAEVRDMKAQNEALQGQVAQISAELRASRHLASARELFQETSDRPALSLHWADAWTWPGGTAPSKGPEKLRKCIDGHNANLSVGPPPADWRTWLQLGLRHGQPEDPAVLRLVVPGADEGNYVGLIWSAAA